MRRWLSAAASLGMLIVTASSMLLPHQGETLRALNPIVSTHDAGSGQDSPPQAVETIKNAHPDEPVLSTRWDTDIVGIQTEQATYTANPATGHGTSGALATPVWVSVLDNLYWCLLSCRGPGHVSWMSREIPHTGWRHSRRGLIVGGLAVATLGVVLTVLTVSELCTQWSLQCHRRIALPARRRTQRFLRDIDLLKATGLVLPPLLFLWSYYVSALSVRPIQPAASVSMTARQSPAGPTSTGPAQDIGPHYAVAVAQGTGGGQAVALFLSQLSDPLSTYTVWVAHRERFTPGQSSDDAAVSIAVNVDPGTGRTMLPSTSGHRLTTRADQRL